jgi:hypothetical protein
MVQCTDAAQSFSCGKQATPKNSAPAHASALSQAKLVTFQHAASARFFSLCRLLN